MSLAAVRDVILMAASSGFGQQHVAGKQAYKLQGENHQPSYHTDLPGEANEKCRQELYLSMNHH